MVNGGTSGVISKKQEHIMGRDAWRANLEVVANAAEKIQGCLGPKGSYKMVTYNRGPEKIVNITKDGSVILNELAFQFPIITIVSEAAKMQRTELGEGVNAFAIFTAALLKKAAILSSKKIHPNLILSGYSLAEEKALELIDSFSELPTGNSRIDILKTLDCGRNLITERVCNMLDLAIRRASKNRIFDKDQVDLYRKQGESLSDIDLVEGVIIEKTKAQPSMPDVVQKPRIAVTSGHIGFNRLEVKMRCEGLPNMKVSITLPDQIDECRSALKKLSDPALEKIRELHVNVVFCQQPIDNAVKSRLSKMGVLAFETVDQRDCKKLATATNAKMVGDLADLSESDVGSAEILKLEKTGLKKIAIVTGTKNWATFLLRGSTLQGLDEIEHAIRDALTLTQIESEDSRIVPGGGALEMSVACELDNYALKYGGREQLAISCFAEALLEIPFCLARNSGLDSISVMGELKRLHAEGFSNYGVGQDGCCKDVCFELAKVKSSVIKRACETVTLMLRIDEQIITKDVARFHKK